MNLMAGEILAVHQVRHREVISACACATSASISVLIQIDQQLTLRDQLSWKPIVAMRPGYLGAQDHAAAGSKERPPAGPPRPTGFRPDSLLTGVVDAVCCRSLGCSGVGWARRRCAHRL